MRLITVSGCHVILLLIYTFLLFFSLKIRISVFQCYIFPLAFIVILKREKGRESVTKARKVSYLIGRCMVIVTAVPGSFRIQAETSTLCCFIQSDSDNTGVSTH